MIHEIHQWLAVRVFDLQTAENKISHQLLGVDGRLDMLILFGSNNTVERAGARDPVMPKLKVCLFESCIHFRETVLGFSETQSLKA